MSNIDKELDNVLDLRKIYSNTRSCVKEATVVYFREFNNKVNDLNKDFGKLDPSQQNKLIHELMTDLERLDSLRSIIDKLNH